MKQGPTEAIILAGGLGTRLRSVVSDVPKPMAPVNGRPFLECLMGYWAGRGIEHFVLSVGYMGGSIQSYFGDSYQGRRVSYSYEDTPLGTGGGFRKALLSTGWRQNQILLVNGDTWYEVDPLQLQADSGAQPITIAVKPMQDSDRYAGVVVDANNRIREFGVKSTGACLINGGCYLIDVEVVGSHLKNHPETFSLEQDFLCSWAEAGRIAASQQDATFLDIGLPADYMNAAKIIGVG